MNFSLIIPTRERVASLNRTLRSLNETAVEKSQIEIIIICDNDDYDTKKLLDRIHPEYPDLIIKTHYRERTVFLNRDYYNWGASFATGRFIWVLGDDVTFSVERWDEAILIFLEQFCKDYPDKVFCVGIKDNTPKPNHILPKFPCFPLFTKEAYLATGVLFHPKVPTWGADYLIYQTYKPVNRLFFISDRCYINHVSNHTGQVESDKTNIRIGNIFNQMKNMPVHNIQRIERDEIPFMRQKLTKYIENWTREHHERVV